MITLQNLTWSNFLSYKDKASIDLSKNSLTQLIGDNGAGKTTIPLVIQEVLYGKNVKNIRKQDLVNRHSGVNGYNISLDFTKDNDTYRVSLDRKSTIKLSLLKNGENISSHKSIDTYKTIAEIIGIQDFKTFCQLVYQSSTGSLEFLTATDTNRKKFLISLLQLEKYIELHEVFKAKVRDITGDLNTIEGELNVIRSWIKSHESMDLTPMEWKDPPDEEQQHKLTLDIASLHHRLNNIKETNKRITNNNQYKKELEELDFNMLDKPESVKDGDIEFWDSEMQSANYDIQRYKKRIKNLKTEDSICPSCKQVIPATDSKDMLEDARHQLDVAKKKFNHASTQKGRLQYIDQEYKRWVIKKNEFEKLLSLIDNNLTSKTEDKVEIEAEKEDLEEQLKEIQVEADLVEEHNRKVAAHNSKIKVIKEQLTSYLATEEELEWQYNESKHLIDILELLKKIFSTNGLVSYKIESSVKELERTINEYLAEFIHFRIFFKLNKDKLNIQVIDEEGEETTIEGLSAGELGRVNIATTLAIRKIMSSLASTKINFLFLDEIVGVLDTVGKEKLIELLLAENLNSFIVAHEFDHPLVPKLYVVKEANASRIENG